MAVEIERIGAVIVGGGPAGLAAAIRLYENGMKDIIIVEREKHLGGILRQCIHDGFGLTRFKTTLSGPEYAERFIARVMELHIPYVTDTTVLHISPDRLVTAASKRGIVRWQAGAVILTMGCRERTRGALGIPGERPAGVFTAGVAQAYINLYNTMPAREAVILGSGDIGMIMARRMTLEGVHVQAVFEIQPYPSGLPRNIEQCLNDYGIPLYLSHTVTGIHGDSRLTGVTVSKVDENMRPIPGTEMEYRCDTLILSVGLIPENELSREAGITLDQRTKGAVVDENYQTDVAGIFAAGNVLHVHDLVDFVSAEAERLADSVTEYLRRDDLSFCRTAIRTDSNISYTIPQYVSGCKPFQLSVRVRRPLKDCRVSVQQNGLEIASKRMKKALPAEMIQMTVMPEPAKQGGEMEVSVEW